MLRRSALVLLTLTLAGCSEGYGSTLLETARGADPPLEYRIVVPDGYTVRSVDYDAALVGIDNGELNTVVRGRGVVAVYAVERATGREVVLVYDDVAARATPTAVIHLDRGGLEARGAPSRP